MKIYLDTSALNRPFDDRLIKRYKGTMQLCNPTEFILLTSRLEQ